MSLAGSASGAALGSGFVVDSSGDIATNAHVVTSDSGQKAKAVFVEFYDGNRVQGRIVGTDPNSDIALLKIDPRDVRGPGAKLVPVPLGSTAGVLVGDPVAAIGSPFGEQQSLSTGVVSALNRDIESLTRFAIGNAIQTDAAINHGNSGGPLLDAKGRVIGINSQIRSSSGGGEGVGFAIPVVTGALVDSVQPNSPAKKAGLHGPSSRITFEGQPGVPVGSDLIVAVARTKLESSSDLSDVIGRHAPGDTVSTRIIRDGKERTVQVTLASRPSGHPG